LKRYTVFLAIPVYLQDLFAGHHDFVFLSQSYRHFTPLSICSCPEAYFIIADRIREKVEEYIEENKVLDNKTFIWIDCNSLEVYISNTDEEYTGIKIPISDFILEEKGNLIPDDDQIECCAATLGSIPL
ncbi:MAG: hypothetical protein IKG90_05330, partial [Bacteroidales bacterium]|nr:hypothetical protein [Bacteroidales bacterium]